MEGLERARELVKDLSTITEKEPCIILVQGKQVKLLSGKMAWRSVAAARSAFSNFLACYLYGNKVDVKTIREELEKEGLIEFKVFKL